MLHYLEGYADQRIINLDIELTAATFGTLKLTTRDI